MKIEKGDVVLFECEWEEVVGCYGVMGITKTVLKVGIVLEGNYQGYVAIESCSNFGMGSYYVEQNDVILISKGDFK